MDKEIATFVPRPNYVTTSVAFQRIKVQVANMHAYTARELSSVPGKTQSPNRPVNTGANEAVSENAAAPDMNTTSAWKEFRGSEFTLMIPVNCTGYGNSLAAMFAPPGGFGRSPDGRIGNVIYGMLTDRYRSQQNLRDDAALDELIREITRDNPGIQPSAQTAITVNRRARAETGIREPVREQRQGRARLDVGVPAARRRSKVLRFCGAHPRVSAVAAHISNNFRA
ncbi:MAG: hypothetical protein JOY54_16235 [Acidobacteriaceae bacterium]|nr:hypothetical protein [Acidobacteriaceae bacterium]